MVPEVDRPEGAAYPVGDNLRVSPTDVSQFVRLDQCQRYLRLRLYERVAGREFLTRYGVGPQPIPPLLTRSGADFEVQTEAAVRATHQTINLASDGKGARRKDDNARVVAAASDLAPGNRMVLFQVKLAVQIGAWAVRGDIDILRMERDREGKLHILIADMKSSRTARVEYWLQVAFYRIMLSALLDEARVRYSDMDLGILYKGATEEMDGAPDAERKMLEEQRYAAHEIFGVDNGLLELVPDPDAYVAAVGDLVLNPESVAAQAAAMPFDEVPYSLAYRCDGCIYNEFCMKWSAERDDLSLVPYLTGVDKGVLRREGVYTVAELARLKEFVPDAAPNGSADATIRAEGEEPPAADGRHRTELVAVRGKERLVRKLASTWPVGPRLDELIYRARYYRKGWKRDNLEARSYLPGRNHGSLPYSAPDHNPNLVRVYIDAQHDYLQDRIYMLGALVQGCEGGVEAPERRRSIVRMTDGPPDSPEKEEHLFVAWVDEVLRAVVELAAGDAEGKRNAPIHLIFFNRYAQKVLLDGLGRHLSTVLGATPVYDFVTQIAAFDSPVLSLLDEEMRELKNYPMVCQSLQAVAAFKKFDWRREPDYRSIFEKGLFDFWARLDEASVPPGESPWYTSRARFKSEIPLEYVYSAWGDLPLPESGKADDMAPYRRATTDLLLEFETLRLEAIEHVAHDFKGNHLTQKTPFSLPDLASFSGKAPSLARALQEFVTIERHAFLSGWKGVRNTAPERRVLLGETLLMRYLEADQDPDAAAANRAAEERVRLRERLEQEYRDTNPYAAKVELSKEQRKEVAWSLEGKRFVLRVETGGVDADLDEVLALTNLREDARVIVFPRETGDGRLRAEARTESTPTPKQMLYGGRATIERIAVERDEAGRARSATVEIEIDHDPPGGALAPFVFSAFARRPFSDGRLFTLDTDANDWYGYYCSTTVKRLCELVEAQGNTGGPTGAATLYDRIAAPDEAEVEWPAEAAAGQARFLEGLRALYDVGAMHELEPGKQEYIGLHGDAPVLLVQGPPGTGKSYGTAFAIFARMQGAMAAGMPFRVFVSCKTHAATDVLLENVQGVQAKLRGFAETQPGIFAQHFDPRLLDVPLMRIAPKHPRNGILALPKDRDREKGAPLAWTVVEGNDWCVVGATPAAIYDMTKQRHDKKLFGHDLCACLVLDEASQMNLPEAMMASLALGTKRQLVVVGDPRQMPPIVKHDWSGERRRTFQEYRTYESLFDTLLALKPRPPMIKFEESFRLHADMAEFLRQEIYSKDSIPYHSRRHALLRPEELNDPFVRAVLTPEHPLVVVVHDEGNSQMRNPFELRLIKPVLEALADDHLYNLDAEDGLGVVVPHRAQRADLQSAIPALSVLDAETGLVRSSAVDTVERYQGDERDVILISATESDREYLLASSNFLYDPRRLTVAISRAKRKMVLVAARSVFSLFSPDEESFANAQLWKNLLRRTCTVPLWNGALDGVRVEVWGNGTSG